MIAAARSGGEAPSGAVHDWLSGSLGVGSPVATVQRSIGSFGDPTTQPGSRGLVTQQTWSAIGRAGTANAGSAADSVHPGTVAAGWPSPPGVVPVQRSAAEPFTVGSSDAGSIALGPAPDQAGQPVPTIETAAAAPPPPAEAPRQLPDVDDLIEAVNRDLRHRLRRQGEGWGGTSRHL